MPEDPDIRPRLSGHLRLGSRTWRFDRKVSPQAADMAIAAVLVGAVLAVTGAVTVTRRLAAVLACKGAATGEAGNGAPS
jgi:hypothetical protein